MASSRRFFFGNPPFRFVAAHLVQDEDFLDDARTLLAIPEPTFQRLAADLAKSDTFLSRSAVTRIATDAMGASENAEQLAKIVTRVAGMLYEADMPASEAMDALASAIEEKTEGLQENDRKVLSQRLRLLAAEPIGLAKQQKAQSLVTATGDELNEFQIVYDIRPVFDQKRERIEGAVPLAIIRLDFTTSDGDSKTVELRVTEKQIRDMEATAQTALRKLTCIKNLLRKQEIVIPTTKATLKDEE